MADVKTHLRELSVATTIGLLKDHITFSLEDLYIPSNFFSLSQKVIDTDISKAINICDYSEFTDELKQIVYNGYKLGCSIYNCPEFRISNSDKISWLGYLTSRTNPSDITVGHYNFSLKEESFILENMGLYKLLNCYTGSSYKKGRHIFKDYAPHEYNTWFTTTWQQMIDDLKSLNNQWSISNSKKQTRSEIKITDKEVILTFKGKKAIRSAILPITCNLSIYENKTDTKIREKVFSKYINERLANNALYLRTKKNCAVVATNNVVNELNYNLNYSAGIKQYLRIYDFEYYYAKSTNSKIEIYKIPSASSFKDTIIIESIKASVPDSQANIITTLKNISTGKKLYLRNECRFSHGQFNGTPEAKMYYEHGSTLTAIYEPILLP